MPVRLVCPSCSATLSVKDEYAGRAVKCPKCGGVIPASQPSAAAPPAAPPPPPSKPAAALPPPPAPAAEKPLFEEVDEPAKPSGPKIKGRPTGKPAKADDAPPAKRRDRGDDREGARDGERGARRRARGDDEDDRPARGKRGRDAEDDDAGDDRGKKKGGSNVAVILGVVALGLLTCCGGVGYGVYYFMNKAKEGLEEFADSLKEKNDKVTSANYQKLKPLMTKAEVEAILGKGKPASFITLGSAYEADTPYNKARRAEFDPKADKERVLVWRNNDDYLFVAFHDKPDAGGKLQMKAFVPKGGVLESSGVSDDDEFAKANNLQPAGGPPLSVSAEELAREFKADKAAAEAKYKDRNLLVEGKLKDIMYGFNGEANPSLEGALPDPNKLIGVTVRCAVAKADLNKVLNLSYGQTVKFRGKCSGLVAGIFVDLIDARFDSAGADPAPNLTALTLLAEHAKNPDATDEKYKEKAVTITGVVESKEDAKGAVVVTGSAKKTGPTRIKAYLPLDAKGQIAGLKPGDKVKVKGEYSSSFEGFITINRAYIVP